jgi:glycosyltransferase involved in cell wall biosynthesis
MANISIGVYVHAEPERLRATLASLCAHTRQEHDLLVLADGPDEETTAALLTMSEISQSNTGEPKGAAACFNRLLRHSAANISILLESGTQLAPGWLEALLVATQRYPKCGLAGPSTNRAWNQQCLFPMAGEGADEISRIATVAKRRFGATCRALEPLHALADFCYLVRREVVDAIGEADEGGGVGPCWEMDYNIRAARAGFQALWACSAYVHRAPLTARRQREEAERVEASKHIPQDKSCELRVRALKSDHRSHCRSGASITSAPTHPIALGHPDPEGAAPPDVQPASAGIDWPLVSCIMPTCNRRFFIPRSLGCFFSQDYPNLELIVVDDGSDPISDLLPMDPRIRYYRLREKLTVGAKRNYANEQARGRFIAHWDDDDWYCSTRVRRQITPLLESKAQISGSSMLYFFNHEKGQAFRYQYRANRPWVAGTTLVYRRSVWEQRPFEAIQVAEDVKFLAPLAADLICDLKDLGLCVGAIHAANVSPKVTAGAFWTPEQPEKVQAILGPEASFAGPRRKTEVKQSRGTSKIMERTGGAGVKVTLDGCGEPANSTVHCRSTVARTYDLSLPEFAAFNHSHEFPHMRRWELPWALYAAQLDNSMSLLACTINPAGFGERISCLYPHVLYRHWNPLQSGVFRLPFGVPDGAFDRVFCINTLEHLVKADRNALIADLARKLKPGGLLLLTSDYYFSSSWNDPAFVSAGVMRHDRSEFTGGWNHTTHRDWTDACSLYGLQPVGPPPPEEPAEDDATCYRNPPPFSHACFSGVFSKGPLPRLSFERKILLALLTWNTRDISVDSLRAYIKEGQMLRRLGYDAAICVCDNGSTDGTVDAIRKATADIDLPCHITANPSNAGNSIARNQIIAHMLRSDADYVVFMDGDIELVPFSSFAMLRYMEGQGHRLGCIGANSGGYSPLRERVTPYLYSIYGLQTEETNLVAWTQYGMFRRAVFEEGVRFDESKPFDGPGWGFEDNDLAFQMYVKGFHNQRFFGMTYLHRNVQSSVRIMRQQGIDPNPLYRRRQDYVIDKWQAVPEINSGPLELVRRIQIRL